eukprot:126421-Amphidinium_carterae.1
MTVVTGNQQAGIEIEATIDIGMMPSMLKLRRVRPLTSTNVQFRSWKLVENGRNFLPRWFTKPMKRGSHKSNT